MEEVWSTDFLAFLGGDISLQILRCLDHPSDLVRASAVSTSWRRFVIESGLCKELCLRMFPHLSDVYRVETELNYPDHDVLAMEHGVYSSLARGLASSKKKRLVFDALGASSTDHFYEGIENTLLPGDRTDGVPSYWSSTGESDPEVPETLLYNLVSGFCVITEIHVQPYEGFEEVQFGCPIYSAKAVRFQVGRSKLSVPEEASIDDFVWTYTSPVFPMIQSKDLQRFLLPEPVLCIGGVLRVELLGRIIKHPLDDLYYICVSHVQALGRNLSPEFEVDILDESGRCILTHDPGAPETEPWFDLFSGTASSPD